MNKKTLLESNAQNFILKGFNSVQVGVYFLIAAFLLKSLLDGFLSDVSMLGMMSIEIIESVGLFLVIFLILFSGLAIFFSSRRQARKSGVRIWNKKSVKQLVFFYLLAIVSIFVMLFTKANGYSMYLGVFFLFFVGFILASLNTKKKKPLYLLAAISIGLAALSYFIPTYWYSSLLILGIAFVVYGIMIRK